MEIKLIKWNYNLKDDLIKICNSVDRKYLSKRMPSPYTSESADRFLSMVDKHHGIDGLFYAIVVDGYIVGSISVEQNEDVYCKDAEIGYMLLPECYSKGVMTNAVRQIKNIAFKRLNIIRLTVLVYKANKASSRVLVKNGFEFEGCKKHAVYKDGNYYDLMIYGIIK